MAEQTRGSDEGSLPYVSDAVIGVTAQAGFSMEAGQSLQLANAETVATISGKDSQFIAGDRMRHHTGQAIGILGRAIEAGESNIGLQLVAAKDALDVQVHRDTASVQARDELNIVSASSHTDWAAAKSIQISTAGGASITIERGNISVQCPGKIAVHAGKKSLLDPERLEYLLPRLPREVCIECLLKAMKTGSALSLK